MIRSLKLIFFQKKILHFTSFKIYHNLRIMKTRYIFLLFLLITSITACKRTVVSPNPPILSSEKELTGFIIESSLNKGFLSETITGIIQDSLIILNIPETTKVSSLIITFQYQGEGVFVGSEKQESDVTVIDLTEPVTYIVRAGDGSEREYKVEINWIPELETVVPQLFINTDEGVPITSKTDYVSAHLSIDGEGKYDNFEGPISIRGRGNTTWNMVKKPYRIKLNSNSSLLGLASGKSWILLANYLDESLMCNAVAFKTARLLNMPFTNHVVPVDVTLNGVYLGNYMFTEQKHAKKNRIDIGDDGLLIEMDINFDEDWEFESKDYGLPVMVQFPELEELSVSEAETQLAQIKSDFEEFESAVSDPLFPGNHYENYFDVESFVNYMIVYLLSDNKELNHPKSTYLYRMNGGKYTMGPVWDFDWGFGYNNSNKTHFNIINNQFFIDNMKGSDFFGRLFDDPETKALFKSKWKEFREGKYEKLVAYTTEYAGIIRESMTRDYAKWRRGSGDSDKELQRLLTWLNARAEYLDGLTAEW